MQAPSLRSRLTNIVNRTSRAGMRPALAEFKSGVEQHRFLFYAYAAFVGSLFLSSKALYPILLFTHKVLIAKTIFAFCLVPLFLLSLFQSKPGLPSALPPSLLFGTTVVYLGALLFSTVLNGPGEPFYLVALTTQILLFLAITAFLVVNRAGFVRSMLILVIPLAALHALLHIGFFLTDINAGKFVNAWGDPVPPGSPLEWYRLWGRLARKWDGPSFLALPYAIFFVACISLLLRSKKVASKIMLSGSGAILLSGLLLTQVRSVYLAAVAGAAVTIKFSYWGGVAIAAFLLITAIAITAVPDFRDAMLVRGLSYRPELWAHYIKGAFQSPWTGEGTFAKIGATTLSGLYHEHPHNVILSAQTRGGLLAAVSLSLILAGGLFFAARFKSMTGEAAPLAMMTTLTVAAMFNYQLLVTGIGWTWVCFWLPIGMCIGAELVSRRHVHFRPNQVPAS